MKKIRLSNVICYDTYHKANIKKMHLEKYMHISLID